MERCAPLSSPALVLTPGCAELASPSACGVQCWLKNQPKPERPWAGAYGPYPAGYRIKHKTTPPSVQWMSGSLTSAAVVEVDGPHWHW